MSAETERRMVEKGDWERPNPGVIRLVGAPRTPEQTLMAAVIEGGPSAIASHESAAWLWDLLPAPDRHAITVEHTVNKRRMAGATVHSTARPPAISFRRRIPCTNPMRTLVDLAAVCDRDRLDEAVDRAIARSLVTVGVIEAELDRLAVRGRRGIDALRRSLAERGMVGAPNPSVLESMVLRLLRRGGIEPAAVEVAAGPDRRYRIDTLLVDGVAMEVDGHAYHSTPEQKAYDEKRRAEIRMGGVFLLVYDWMSVKRDGRRVLAECHKAIARYGHGRSGGRLTGS